MTACFSLIISQTPWYENDVTIVSNKFLIGKQEEEIRGTFFLPRTLTTPMQQLLSFHLNNKQINWLS